MTFRLKVPEMSSPSPGPNLTGAQAAAVAAAAGILGGGGGGQSRRVSTGFMASLGGMGPGGSGPIGSSGAGGVIVNSSGSVTASGLGGGVGLPGSGVIGGGGVGGGLSAPGGPAGLVSSSSNPPRALTPPSQHSPNSFLASLSSRLLQSRTMSSQYPSAIGRATGLSDIFDGVNMSTSSANNLLASFRAVSGGLGLPNSGGTHHNFGIPTGSGVGGGPPSALDLSEFPSLGGSSTGGSLLGGGSSGAPGSSRPAYVGMVKEVTPSNSSSSEFTIHSEDFPALPGSNSSMHLGSGGGGGGGIGGGGHDSGSQNSVTGGGSGLSGILGSSSVGSNFHTGSVVLGSGTNLSSASGDGFSSSSTTGLGGGGGPGSGIGGGTGLGGSSTGGKSVKRGIQTSKDGRVTNIPSGMVTDQFGMVGLLTFIRAAESDPNLVSLALGTDLTTLKLDLNSSENLYSTFPGPWSDSPLKPHEIDFPVPSEYLINYQIRDKLAPIKLGRYGDDTLFFLFYMYPNDMIQVAAASELYVRDWRYHKDEKVWITRAPGMPPNEKTNSYERGTYYFFDAINWRRVAKEFHLDYDRLENRPPSAAFNHVTGAPGVGSSSLLGL